LRLDTKFDNHEREKLELPTVTSKTYFSSRLAPVVGVGWESRNKNGTIGRHSMMAGGSVTLDFSSRPPYGRHLEPQLYYNFNSPNYSLYAGVFERRRLIGSYSRVTYSGVASFYDNIVQGLAMQYHGPGSRFEVALDWDGSQSETERESFRVLLAGDWNRAKQISMRWFEAGFSVDWYHLASRTGAGDGVVEHILGDARLGAAFEKIMPWFERLAISAGWLQSMDRDRAYGLGSWLSPGGVTVDVAVQKWRVGVRNRYYHGVTGPGKGVQMPLWSAYGSRIYKGDPIYASARTYNYTSIYWRPTIGRSVDLNLELGLHSNGVKTGFQQVLWVGVTLDNDFFRKK
jgi:hypothetical protein